MFPGGKALEIIEYDDNLNGTNYGASWSSVFSEEVRSKKLEPTLSSLNFRRFLELSEPHPGPEPEFIDLSFYRHLKLSLDIPEWNLSCVQAPSCSAVLEVCFVFSKCKPRRRESNS